MYARNAESRFENGSSSRKIVGRMIIERPSATFWRSFTDSRAAVAVERGREADGLGDLLDARVDLALRHALAAAAAT